MAWLLDTNVLSDLRRPRPNQKVVAFVAGCALDQLYISVITLAEIRFGIELVGDPNHRVDLNHWLANRVRPMFDERVLQISEDIMLRWRLLVEEGRKAGHTFSQPDLIIAALPCITALQWLLAIEVIMTARRCRSLIRGMPHRTVIGLKKIDL
jgi:predicted nucleic acid-binding protein